MAELTGNNKICRLFWSIYRLFVWKDQYRIIEYKYFIPLMDYAEVYFESAHEEGFLTRNSVIDLALATADISEYMKSNPLQAKEEKIFDN